jgi:hypothetical protein
MGTGVNLRLKTGAVAATGALLVGGANLLGFGAPAGAQSLARNADTVSPTQFSFVANYNTDSVTEFAGNANGSQGYGVAEIGGTESGGSATGLNGPTDVAVYAGNVFVANGTNDNSGNYSITVYPEGASGNVAPMTTIEGANTGLARPQSLAFDSSGDLFVSNFDGTPGDSGGSVVEFTPSQYDQSGTLDIAPYATLGGSDTGLDGPWGLAFDSSGNLFVANELGDSITEYAPGAMGGDASPANTLSGTDTGLDYPAGVAVDPSGNLYVANSFGDSITEYPSVEGDVPPSNTISGNNTGLSEPEGIALDSAGDVYVANSGVSELDVWDAGDSGNLAPDRSITGYDVFAPTGVTLAPVGTPGAPTIGNATGGNSSATVSFTPPSSNGGAPVTSYTVTANDETDPTNGGQTATATGSPITVTGLTNGDTYDLTVTATNAVGTGPSSQPSNAVTPIGQPSLSITPSEAKVGSPLALSGQNFQPGETVVIHVGSATGKVVASEAADSSGSFSSTGSVPVAPYGTYQLLAVGSTSGDTAQAPFTVEAAVALSPNSASPGSSVHATLTGFAPDQSVSLRFNSPSGTLLGRATTSSAGRGNVDFDVPAGATGGTHYVYALGQGGPYARTSLTVTSSVAS